MSIALLWKFYLVARKVLGFIPVMFKFLNNLVFNKNEKNFEVEIKDYTILVDDLNERYSVSFSVKIKNFTYLNFLLNSVSCEVSEKSKQILPEFNKIIFEKINHDEKFIFSLNYFLDPYEVLKLRDCGEEKRKELTVSFNFFLQIGTQIFKIHRSITDNFFINITNKEIPVIVETKTP